ncbi:MAG: hypothetical protein JHC40_06195 [Burkholderiales bacterium]|nr:hypothetical protein [Burkholderiales bacterium]
MQEAADRAGLRRMAQQRGIVLQGWLARLIAQDWSADQFTDALLERKRVVNSTWRFMQNHDFLITPTTASVAFPVDLDGPAVIDGRDVESTAWLAFSALGNLTGLPAASVPIGFTRDGLPIGLQIMGSHLDDLGVLALAAAVEGLYATPCPPIAGAALWEF